MKKKLSSFVVITIVVAIFVAGAGVALDIHMKNRLTNALISDYIKQQETTGEAVTATLSSNIQNIKNSLNSFALDKDIQSGDAAKCNAALKKHFEATVLGIHNLGRVGLDGKFRCSLNSAIIGAPYNRFGNYLDPMFSQEDHPTIVSDQIVIPNVSGYVIAVHVPVYDDQKQFLGSLGGAIYMEQLAESYLSKVKFAETGFAGLRDDNGDILYSQFTELIGKNFFDQDVQSQVGNIDVINAAVKAANEGQRSNVEYVFQGKSRVASFIPLEVTPGHRWTVVINTPREEIVAILNRVGINQAFLFGTVVLVFAIVLIISMMLVNSLHERELQKAKDQFVSLASHQLRTPLTSIRWFSEMLSDNRVGKLSPIQLDYVEKIELSARRMITLVGNILNVSRIEMKRLKIEPHPNDIVALVKSYVDEVQPLAAEKKVTLNAVLPAKKMDVLVDPTLFEQIVHNLLTNAVRYTRADVGKVELVLEQEADGYHIIVKDNGIGIPKADQSKIFKQFHRAPNALKVEGEGTGLGLYIIKMIADLSGCSVSFQSVENQGTTFNVTIPLQGMQAKNGDKGLANGAN